jgi:hypothetical protein
MYCHAEHGSKGINDTGKFSVAVLCRQELTIEDSIAPQPFTCFHAPAFGQSELDAINLL